MRKPTIKSDGRPPDDRHMYRRLRLMNRLGLLGPLVRLQRRIDGR